MAETAPEKATCLLLDMDGVMAEVSKSYRASIVATCHQYNATGVSNDTVSACKAKGGCNNDWVLSLDLINADPNGTKGLTLEQVTETFESFYQGTAEKAGLCDLESLIPRKELLEDLYKKCDGKMAVVTGRPRKDCNKFLELYGIKHLFKACVCMEDGPWKPDPFPVAEACRLLNVEPSQRVIMVGDTPDDIRSAHAAGCRGVGVATPEDVKAQEAAGKEFDSGKLSQAIKDCGGDQNVVVVVLRPGFEDLLDMF